ncbi:MAG: nucleoside deaminase [Candidatus Micrarchaeia archaeon]|jgi:tRNA(Arg) A34 adenosine deaminase TadA
MKDPILIAIDAAKKGMRKGNSPFGCAIIKNGKLISTGNSTVLEKNDPTSHAEINAIRIACKKLKTFDLSNCTLYSTTEPCPMCFSAIHWARIKIIYYGTDISDVKKLGFSELVISNHLIKKLGQIKIKIIKNYKRKECLDLLKKWKKNKKRKTY